MLRGAVPEQEIEHVEIGECHMHGRAFEAEHRLVDSGGQIGVVAQQPPHAINFARFDRRLKQLDRRLCQ